MTMKDNMFKKIAFNAAVFVAFAAASAFSASTAKADSVDFATFVAALKDANYNFDGSNHASAEKNGKLTVKWSPVSGCFDNRGADGHTCTVENVTATENTPERVNSELAQFQILNGETSDVTVKNVAFVYEPADFTICANSDWKGTFTADTVKSGQIYLMNTGSVTFEDCSFEKVVLTSFNCAGTSTVKGCSFKDVYNSYAIKDIRGGTVSVTGCSFEDCGAAIMVSAESTAKVEKVTISGNTFKNVDVEGTTKPKKIGTRGIIQIASAGDYSATTYDFSNNKAENCGPVIRQLNTSVSLTTTETGVLKTLVTGSSSLLTIDSSAVTSAAAMIGTMEYATLEAALADVAEGKPLSYVTEATWPVATPVYYNGNFYGKGDSKGALELAIDAANEANSSEVAKIYVRPGFDANELVLGAHQNLKTSLAIYGNDAKLSSGWEPCIENSGTEYHTLTKDVSIAIYNLHNGAGVWGSRQTGYTVGVTLADCRDVHEVMINGSSADAASSVNNYTVKRCTFDGTLTASKDVTIASTSAGTIVVKDCTFANLNADYVINPNNKNGGAMGVVIKNTSFTNCGTSSKAAIRVAGEVAGTSATVVLDSLTFDEYSAANAIGIGKKELAENLADITYTISNTAGTLSVFEKGGSDTTITPTTTTLVATETYTGGNNDFYQDDAGVWHIATPKGLVTFSEKTAAGTTFAGLTVMLDGDIDMKDVAYTSAKQFNGTFDGNGKKISNLTISECDASHTWSGLIAYSVGGTVKDLTITGATVDCVRGAVLLGNGYGLTIDGVTVSDSVVTGEQKCAGLLGMACEESTHKITNCEVKNVQLKAATTTFSDVQGASFAGLVAFIHRDTNVTITGNKVSGITFSGLLDEAYFAAHETLYYQYLSHPFIAALIGTTASGTYDSTTTTLSGNTVEATEGLLTGPTSNEYLGFYYRSDFSTRAVTKIVIDGEVLVNRLVAQVGETVYGSLADAFAAAEAGQTVKLLADLTETDAKSDAVPYIMTGVTFDLNKKTYTHYNYAHTFQGTGGVIKNGKIVCAPYGSDEGAANGSYALFIGYHVNDGGKYEATKTAETTSFKVQDVTMTGGINISHATGVVLENLTVNGTKYYAVWTEDGSSVTIKSGTYTTGAVSLLNGENATTMTVEGGTFKAGEKSLVGISGVVPSISGGTFDTAVDAKYCASGFIPADNGDGTYGVADAIQVLDADKTVAGSYHSFADAFEAAEAGQTVKLLANLTENATIAKNLTLDLNGFTLNGGTVEATPTLTVTAKVTIKDSSEAQTGTIKREDTAENSGVTSHYVIDIQGSGASLTFESGNVVNNSGTTEGERAGASLVRVGNDGNVDAMPTLTIKGGTFTQNNFTAIKVDYGTFYFQGGTITCKKDEAVKNWASAYIQGGTVNGTVASWVYKKSLCSSTLEISGGTVNGNVYAMTYDGVGDKTATVNITGGTITGDLGTYQGKNIKSMTKFSDASKATIAVTGGKFKNDIKESGYLASELTTIHSESAALYVVAPENSQLVTVKTEETTEDGETEKTVQVALTETVINEALKNAGITDDSEKTAEKKTEVLSKTDTNGNPVWVNLVAGIDSKESVAVDAAQNTDASTIDVSMPELTVADGFSIAYEVDEVTLATSDGKTTAEVTKAGDVVSAPAIDIDNVETSALFRVNVVLRQNGSTVATVPATNYIGVLKKTTKMTKTIVPVPWHSLADGGDISVSNVVKTANLTKDDKLSVYDVANKKYNVYTLKEDKTWEPAAVYVIDANGQVSESSSEKPETMEIPRGSGVWLERSNTDTPIVTYGLASTAKQATTLVAAKTTEGEGDDGATTTATWSLVAVPTTEAVSLTTVSDPKEATNDAVIVPTEGAPKIYTVAEDGKWGYNEATEVVDANGKSTGIIKIERKTDDATLPAGTGFWYVNGGGEKSVNW